MSPNRNTFPQSSNPHCFWRGASVYQVYPWSFNEHKTIERPKGHGSIKGITAKLDYLKDLGVTVIWVSPFYPSPMFDGGYDVENYVDIHPDLGTLDDFDELVARAAEHGIKLMVDLVPNHSSHLHPWFVESRQSANNPKSDWYIWRDPKPDGSVPNNWASVFSMSELVKRQAGEMPELNSDDLTPPASAWEYDEVREQYYLHSFESEQPDLNWENPAVRQAIMDVMRFWLDRGVDGFRIDAVNYIGKDMSLVDEERDPDYKEGVDNPYDQLRRRHSAGYPGTLYKYLAELASVLEEPAYEARDPRIIFEAYMDEHSLDTINRVAPEVAGTFNFGAMQLDWNAQLRKAQLDDYYKDLPEQLIPNQVNGNHDNSRIATRIGDLPARSAAVHNLMLPGMPFIYQGEEGGFTDVDVPSARQKDALRGRDPERTPMLWDGSRNAGFSFADEEDLWLPIDPDYPFKNLQSQLEDPDSSLSLYKALLAIRAASPAVKYGSYISLSTDTKDAIGFLRQDDEDQLVVITNFSDDEKIVRIHHSDHIKGHAVLSSIKVQIDRPISFDNGVRLLPHESIVIV